WRGHRGGGWGLQDSGGKRDRVRGLAEAESGIEGPIERALKEAPARPLGLVGPSFLSQPALHAAGEVRRRGLALDQVLERSQLETSLDELLFAVVREDDHRNVSRLLPAAKPFQHREAIHLW